MPPNRAKGHAGDQYEIVDKLGSSEMHDKLHELPVVATLKKKQKK